MNRLPGMPPADLLEAELQASVIELARVLGWRVAHFRPALTKHGWRTPVSADGKGFPDLVLVHERKRRILWRELKTRKGKLTEEQQAWQAWLVRAGADYAVWTPADWPGVISAELQGDA